MKKGLLFLFILMVVAWPVHVQGYVLPVTLRVGLESRFNNVGSIAVSNTDILVGYETNGVFMPYDTLHSPNGFIVKLTDNAFVGLFSGGQLLASSNGDNQLQIRDAGNGFMAMDGYTYRGVIAFMRGTGSNVTAINVLTHEDYLYSVVASEMYAAFHIEALKAQAVAARSYTLTRMGVHKDQGYDLCDRSHCQQYRGTGVEFENAIKAVNETCGLVMYHNGQPINAVFFSSSGGVTDDSANVWTQVMPYLKSVTEISEFEPKEWTRSFTLSEISSLLASYNAQIGSATGIAITQTNASGRVQELTVYGASGSLKLTKEEIRNFFSPSSGGTLESRNFTLINGTVSYTPTMVAVTDGVTLHTFALNTLYTVSGDGSISLLTEATVSDGESTIGYKPDTQVITAGINGVVFSGRGWGHGVGMSQRGAEGMARLGYDFMSILNHYYTEVVIY